ncbi:DUF317 domain-containing protein [Yinghuangia sp. ASG 101]|uniref:DUF317 domain-containing protein n=1 Tax=Yinghuangia sp. ASG 101 TaxID=2896848 RepID=UPI001E49B47B|nr:DUF317 domain-containing protein [Yinghuangia sp. ASG 101]UGQ10926.1 DUF317 domain-containing protein [Yinghuangia sp. ASG 101]
MTAPGWIWESDECGGTYAASASRQLLVVHRPNHDVQFTWSATWAESPVGEQVWMVAMTDSVPDEIVHAVTSALRALPEAAPHTPGRSTPAEATRSDHSYTRDRTDPDQARRDESGSEHPVLDVLDSAGWQRHAAPSRNPQVTEERSHEENVWERVSPTGHGWITRHPDEGPGLAPHRGHYAWELSGDPYRNADGSLSREGWRVTLTARTPAAVLMAAVTAMCDPAPVRRQAADVLRLHTHLLRALPVDWATPSADVAQDRADRKSPADRSLPAAQPNRTSSAVSTTAKPAAQASPTQPTRTRR